MNGRGLTPRTTNIEEVVDGDLNERPALAVAYSVFDFIDHGIPRRIDATEATVTSYLDAVAKKYGIEPTFPKLEDERGDLTPTTAIRPSR